jgi:hypothetical protein
LSSTTSASLTAKSHQPNSPRPTWGILSVLISLSAAYISNRSILQ